ncbi:MAG: hypothetical protein DWQ05_00295 [Calditrichaeota bacterium]|nr:MAG: hypothetical protein DWQ05_00295 [Calditrichota bacterium]
MNTYKIMALLVFCATLLFSAEAFAQKSKNKKSNAKAQTEQVTQTAEENQALTAWDILEMTSWLFWPFVFVTGAGVTFICYRGLIEYQEKTRSQSVLQKKIEVRELRSLIRTMQKSQPNRASRLLQQMVSTFNKTNRAEPISADVTQFVNSEREAYETFNRVLGFLSDTAGALGLLGTVWGIFETFHGGKLDGPTILMGMSISLVTTLVGLLISLALNFGGTTIFAIFNRYMNTLSVRAEELRQALLYLETRPNKSRAQENGNVSSATTPVKIPAPERRSSRPVASKRSYSNSNGASAAPEKQAPPVRREVSRQQVEEKSAQPAVTEVTEDELLASQEQNMPDVFARQNPKYDDEGNVW